MTDRLPPYSYHPDTEPSPDSWVLEPYALALLGIAGKEDLVEETATELIHAVSLLECVDEEDGLPYMEALYRADHIYKLRRNLAGDPDRTLLYSREAARALGVSHSSIKEHVYSGALLPAASVPYGDRTKRLLFDARDIEYLIDTKQETNKKRSRGNVAQLAELNSDGSISYQTLFEASYEHHIRDTIIDAEGNKHRLITVDQAATILGVTSTAVRKWQNDETLSTPETVDWGEEGTRRFLLEDEVIRMRDKRIANPPIKLGVRGARFHRDASGKAIE